MLARGAYLYVGSAHGPGGLRARLGRHLAGAGRPHWHIDYLRATARPLGVLVRCDSRRQECAWSRWLLHQGAAVVAGFGANDCRCQGHLYHAGARPQLKALLKMATADLGASYLDTIGLGTDGDRRDGPEP